MTVFPEGSMLEHHPHRSFAHLRRIPAWSCHRSILSRNGVSNLPGAVQSGWLRRLLLDLDGARSRCGRHTNPDADADPDSCTYAGRAGDIISHIYFP